MFHLNIKALLFELNRQRRKYDMRRLTLKDVAKACGVSHTTAKTWASDNGVASITAEQMASLLQFFGLKSGDLDKILLFDMEDTQPIKPIDEEDDNEASV